MKIHEQITEYKIHCVDDKGATDATMRGKNWVLDDFAKSIPVDDLRKVTEEHINAWLEDQINRGCSGRTANNRFHIVRPMINYYRDMGMKIPVRLCKVKRQFETPPRRVYFTSEQIETVLSYCNPMDWLLIKLPFDSGLRLTELTNLRLREINGRRLDYIGKCQKQRESYMSPEARKRLDDYIAKNHITDYLWRNPYDKTGKPYSTGTIYKRIKRVLAYAGFDEGYPHALRHSFATDLQINGASTMESRDMLGHESVETTQKYLHGLDGHLQNLFDQYKFGLIVKPEIEPRKQSSKLDDGAVNFMRKLAEEFASVA